MKIIFIENRYKTYLYQEIAKQLIEKDYHIHFVVQNHSFKSNTGKNHVINYPSNNLPKIASDKEFNEIIKSDRQLNFFKKKDKRYLQYYYNEIKNILIKLQPKVVFGEATAFHELMTIKICKELDILYLNPCTSRYPVGRFSFYLYDTLEPFNGSNSVFPKEDVVEIIDSIVHKKVTPDYMKVKKKSKLEVLQNKLKIITAYYKGETYNTPSPIIKYCLGKELKNKINKWKEISTSIIDNKSFSVLYPMQMQPEANIDVWGRKHRDQLQTIKKIQKNLESNEVLYVKLNPKCKYELSNELIDFVNSHVNVLGLDIHSKMEEVLPKIDLVLTVTGTIAIECILMNKPVLTLIETINNTNKNCLYIDSIDELKNVIPQVKNGIFPILTQNDKIQFINLLTKTSYKGIISDLFSDMNCISKENVDRLSKCFVMIINENK